MVKKVFIAFGKPKKPTNYLISCWLVPSENKFRVGWSLPKKRNSITITIIIIIIFCRPKSAISIHPLSYIWGKPKFNYCFVFSREARRFSKWYNIYYYFVKSLLSLTISFYFYFTLKHIIFIFT